MRDILCVKFLSNALNVNAGASLLVGFAHNVQTLFCQAVFAARI